MCVQRAGEVLRTMLRVSEAMSDNTAPSTNPISTNEVRYIVSIGTK